MTTAPSANLSEVQRRLLDEKAQIFHHLVQLEKEKRLRYLIQLTEILNRVTELMALAIPTL